MYNSEVQYRKPYKTVHGILQYQFNHRTFKIHFKVQHITVKSAVQSIEQYRVHYGVLYSTVQTREQQRVQYSKVYSIVKITEQYSKDGHTVN